MWIKVKENPNYEVSDDGNIRRNGHILAKNLDKKSGYYKINLYDNGKKITRRINRLVAEAYISNPNNLPEVNHIDGDKANNNVSNLEWVTKSENMQHAFKNGLARPSYGMLGKKNPNAGRKGKPFKIVETNEVFNTLAECEKRIKGNNRHINDCLKGRQKTHRGYHFEYI